MIKAVLLISLSLLVSCATIINGREQKLRIVTIPDNATVFVNNKELGKTPLTINLKRKNNYNIIIKKDGYSPIEFEAERNINHNYYLNCHPTLWGVWGMTMDIDNGSAYDISPSEIEAYLVEIKEAR
jgi:hypothetical protein